MPRNLSHRQIIETAVVLAQSEGLDAITLSRLAKELEIRTASLYNHIDGIESLKCDLAIFGMDKLLDEIKIGVIGKSGPEALITVMFVYRSFAKLNSGIYDLIFRVYENQQQLDQQRSELIRLLSLILKPFNLSWDDEIHLIRGLRSFIHGFVSLELNQGFRMEVTIEESYSRFANMIVRTAITLGNK